MSKDFRAGPQGQADGGRGQPNAAAPGVQACGHQEGKVGQFFSIILIRMYAERVHF